MKTQGSAKNNQTFINYWKNYPLAIDLRILECGMEQCDPLHYWGPALKAGYIIHYIISGKGTLKYLGKCYHLSAGDGFVLSPDYESWYEADEADPWTYRWLMIKGNQAKVVLSTTSLLTSPTFHYDADSRLEDHLAKIYEVSQSSTAADLLVLGHTMLFLADLVELFPAARKKTNAKARELILESTSYIEANYHQPISASDIASQLGISRTYLFKLFKQYYGMSPTAFLEEIRLSHACNLLRSGKLTIKEIAYMCGYNDPSYFSYIFKRSKGVAPAFYAKTAFASR